MLIYLDHKTASLLLSIISKYKKNNEQLADVYKRIEEGLKDYV